MNKPRAQIQGHSWYQIEGRAHTVAIEHDLDRELYIRISTRLWTCLAESLLYCLEDTLKERLAGEPRDE